MGNTIVQSQLKDVQVFLETTVERLENFLNETTFSKLQQEKNGDEKYYKGILFTIIKTLMLRLQSNSLAIWQVCL